jgi:hypothetical protein
MTSLEVFPNPATEMVQVVFYNNESSAYQVLLTDILGNQVLHSEGTAVEGINSTTLDLSTLARGIYFISLISGEGTNQVKLLIQ